VIPFLKWLCFNCFNVGEAADANEHGGLSEEAQEFQRWKSSVLLGKYKFKCDDPNVFPPRDEWKDREIDLKQVEKMIEIVKKTGSMADKSVWVIDSKTYRSMHRSIGSQMFTKEFCTGQKSEKGNDLASQEEIVAWIEKQKRERIAGNHTLECAKQLRTQYKTNPVFQFISAEIWLVDSKVEDDNKKVIYWAGQENIVANSGKTTPALERVLYFHKWLERRGFFTQYKLDEFGDIMAQKGYFKDMIEDMMKAWSAERSTVTNYLNIARSYGAEWTLLKDIMSKTHGKGSQTGQTGAYFWVGSSGVPVAERIVWFSKFNQDLIDSKELKAAFLAIKQFRALQQCSLDLANDFRYLNRRTWHAWADLTTNLPTLTQGVIDTYRSSFKVQRKSKKNAKGDADGVEAPDAFKKKLIELFQQQTLLVESRSRRHLSTRPV
jgi:hypothetical protein